MAKNLLIRLLQRTCFVVICLCALFATTGLRAQQITLRYPDTPLKTVLQEIQKQSGYKFVYSNSLVDVEQRVSVDIRALSLTATLDKVLLGTKISYRIIDKNITLTPRQETKAAADSKNTFSGRVVDENGGAIVGATIISIGGGHDARPISCVTGLDGGFSLHNVQPGTRFIISYIGKTSQPFTFESTEPATITLPTDIVNVDEVVVIGYGSKNRQDLTSAISSLSGKEVERLAVSAPTVDNMLGGAVKGVLSQQSSGEPGAITTLNIRGTTSPYPNMATGAQNNVPLYVIDGIPFFLGNTTLNPLSNLSPNDIESIDILKDAAATAIYGSRGANGVVIVKTKNGRKGDKISVDVGYSISIANPVKSYKPLSTKQYKQHVDEVLSSTVDYMNATGDQMPYYYGMDKFGLIDLDYDSFLFTYNGLNEDAFGSANTNWIDQIRHKNAITHQYNIGVRGGTEKTSYSVSFNAINQDGLYINDYYQRYNTRIAVDSQVARTFSIGGSLSYSYGKRKSASLMEGFEETSAPYAVRPDQPVYDADGNFNRIDASTKFYGMTNDIANPVALRQAETIYANNSFNGMFYSELTLCEGLKLHGDINFAIFDSKNSYFTPTTATDYIPDSRDLIASLSTDDSRDIMTSTNFRLDYDTYFGEKHHFGAMVGYGADRTFYEGYGYWYEGFLDNKEMHTPGAASSIISYSSSKRRGGLNSVYARASYDYDNRYLAEASLRADASSKFGPGNQWGVFPALSLGWRINNEKWLRETRNIDNLKLRASIGRTGSTNVADFSYNQYFTRTSSTMYGGQMAITINDLMPNQNIKWEMTTEVNVGVDFGFFNNRLFGSIDAYSRKTDGALSPAPHSLESGLSVMYANLIDMTNKGVEVEIGGDIIRSNQFTWNSVFNIATNTNRVKRLNGANLNDTFQDAISIGYPAGTLKGYQVVKIFNDQDELDRLNEIALEKTGNYYQDFSVGLGDYMIRDIDNSGSIDSNDRTVIANPEPSCFGGWTNTLTWKGLSLSFMFQYSIGGQALYNALLNDATGNLGDSITEEMFGNTWTPERTNARYARQVFAGMNAYYYNASYLDRYVFDTSYMRMKYLTLSYDLPKTWMSKLRISSAQIYVTATNLFTISNWPGIDPEQVSSNLLVSKAVNADPYPLSRSFTFGVKLNF